MIIDIIDLGAVDYEQAYKFQRQRCDLCKKDAVPDTLILCQHPPVFTIGRAGSENNINVDEQTYNDKGVTVYHIDRGGDITYHGPGQLIAYPIFNLKNYGQDIHLFLRNLEQVVIDFLAGFGIQGRREEGRTGVWVKGAKISSIGVGVSSWVSYHGLAFNIDCEDEYFSMINPCGFKDIKMTSLLKELSVKKDNLPLAHIEKLDIDDLKKILVRCFEQVFNVTPCPEKVG